MQTQRDALSKPGNPRRCGKCSVSYQSLNSSSRLAGGSMVTRSKPFEWNIDPTSSNPIPSRQARDATMLHQHEMTATMQTVDAVHRVATREGEFCGRSCGTTSSSYVDR